MSEEFEYIEQNAEEVAGIVMAAVKEAVGKQIPMKPDKGKDIDGVEYAACPKCYAILADKDWRANYCPDCGQRIDWEEEYGSRTD